MPSLNSEPHLTNTYPSVSYGTIEFINPQASISSFLTGRYRFTSCWAAVFLTVNACIGAGLLNVPQVFDESGSLLISFIIQAILLVFITGSLIILSYCVDISGTENYQDVVRTFLGDFWSNICSYFIVLHAYGCCITFFVIIGDQSDRLLASLYGNEFCHFWYMNRHFTIPVISTLLVLPLCFSKHIEFLKWPSSAGLAVIFYVLFLIFYEYSESKVETHLDLLPKSWTTVPVVIPVICFAYQVFLVLFFLLTLENVSTVNYKYKIRPELDSTRYFLFGGVKADNPVYDNDINVDPNAYHDIYRYDNPIPMGMPIGFFTEKGRGRPVGLLAYMCHLSWVPTYARMKETCSSSRLMVTIVGSILVCALAYTWAIVFGILTFGTGKLDTDLMKNYDPKEKVVLIGIVALIFKTVTTYPLLLFCARIAIDRWYKNFTNGLVREPRRRAFIVFIWFFSTLFVSTTLPDIGQIIDLVGTLTVTFIFIFPGMCLLSSRKIARDPRKRFRNGFISVTAWSYVILGCIIFVFSLIQVINNDFFKDRHRSNPLCLPE